MYCILQTWFVQNAFGMHIYHPSSSMEAKSYSFSTVNPVLSYLQLTVPWPWAHLGSILSTVLSELLRFAGSNFLPSCLQLLFLGVCLISAPPLPPKLPLKVSLQPEIAELGQTSAFCSLTYTVHWKKHLKKKYGDLWIECKGTDIGYELTWSIKHI